MTKGQKGQVSSMLRGEGAWHALGASMAGTGKQNTASPEAEEDQGSDRLGPWDAGEDSFHFKAISQG